MKLTEIKQERKAEISGWYVVENECTANGEDAEHEGDRENAAVVWDPYHSSNLQGIPLESYNPNY